MKRCIDCQHCQRIAPALLDATCARTRRRCLAERFNNHGRTDKDFCGDRGRFFEQRPGLVQPQDRVWSLRS